MSMRKIKIFISLVVAIILCVALVGCAGNNSSNNPAGQQAAQTDENNGPATVDDNNGPATADEPVDNHTLPEETTPSDPVTPADGEVGVYDSSTGMYRHEFLDRVFYTDNDINQWIHGDEFDFLGMCEYFGLTRGFVLRGNRATTPERTEAEKDNNALYSEASLYSKSGSTTPEFYDSLVLVTLYGHTAVDRGNRSYAELHTESSRMFVIRGEDSSSKAPVELLELALWGLEQLSENPRQENIFTELNFTANYIYTY